MTMRRAVKQHSTGADRPDADVSNAPGEFGDSSSTVADCDNEPAESTVSRQTAFQTSSQYSRVNVAATQRYNHPDNEHPRPLLPP